MSVWLEIPRRHPDGSHKTSGQTTVWSAFQISQKFFPELSRVRTVLPCRPDDRTLAGRNFHINASHVWTIEHVIWMVYLMHAISIYVARMSGPWRLAYGRLDFECITGRLDKCVWTGIHIIRTVAIIFPYLCFGKKSHSWSNIEWCPNVLLKRLEGCKLEQFEAFRYRGRS